MSITTRRKERGWSIRELSRRSGVAFGYLSEIERDDRGRSIDSLTVGRVRKIAAALGTTAAELVAEEEREA